MITKETLPSIASLSPAVLTFLDGKLDSVDGLGRASNLVSQLQTRCNDLDQNLTDLSQRLGASLVALRFLF
ncbi:unnamed protein product [Thlaspi arvense]|uniref:Uncharacterized protein n=1 Tax=Thlaspi arvense TaxID=13288 RepID=A0AAU9RKE6_THLAR|nr:unnamed protein product [Thlaspi arvense]